MNSKLTLLAVIEIISALSLGIAILAATYQVLKYVAQRRYGIGENNQAFGIFMASTLFSVGYLVSGVIRPLLSLFRILATRDISTVQLAATFIGYGALYVFLAFIAALIVIFLSVTIYSYITPTDEAAEMKNNNIAVALVVASIIITLSLMTSDGVELLIESFIPYPPMYPK
ncbi:MAG: DUF350 domain-containing protein [Cyclobacteriaceae bacterium]|jgi:uncharacterized membrane protein YjfL (UPF0719 family)|nr:hypothetical protein [Cytophagales bacterium]HNP78627.1 DUF350 domain-containing protein [Cyclobacteriaceae bacterium]HQQ97679.1 DUF350 domain-containing protein [Cyclobacteriaceae bacterium]